MKFLVLSLLLIANLSLGAIINGTAAKVGKKIITLRDVHFYYGLLSFKDGRLRRKQNLDRKAMGRVVQKMILEEMVYSEAKQFQYKGNSKKQAMQMVAKRKVKQASNWENLLRRYGRSEGEAVTLFSRALVVEQFVQRKVDAMTPIITEAEIERFYRQNSAQYAGKSLSSVKTGIEGILKKQKVEKGLKEWVRFLEKKYEVANLLEP